MKKGKIELYNWEGALLRERLYQTVIQRNMVVNVWKRRYAESIGSCYLQITPHTDSDRVKPNGENDNVGPKRKYKRYENNKDLNPLRKADPTKAELIYFRPGIKPHPYRKTF